MTDDDSIMIEKFEAKIRKLMDLYNDVKRRNSQLIQEIEAKNKEIRQLREEVSSLKESYLNLKQSKVLEV